MVLKKLIQFENIGMVEFLEDVDFGKQLHLVFVSKAFLIYNFDGSEDLGLTMQTLANLAKGAYSTLVRKCEF